VVIPTIGAVSLTQVCVRLIRAADPDLYIIIVDTGTQGEEALAALESLRDERTEVHYIRAHGWPHASQPVAAAMDLGQALTRTRHMVAMHNDAFLTGRGAIDELLAHLGEDTPVAGYQITERPHWRFPDGSVCEDWRWMIGHTFAAFDLERLREVEIERGVVIRWDLVCGAAREGWPIETNIVDTEVFINYAFRRAGCPPKLIGTERNYKRNKNEHFDHVRSYPSAQLYCAKREPIRQQQERWLKQAMREARERLSLWESSP